MTNHAPVRWGRMGMRLPIAAMFGLALAACGQTAADRVRTAQAADEEQAGLRRELAGLVPGQPSQCLPTRVRTDLRGYGTTLIYRVSDRLKYRTETSGGCEGVGRRDDILVTRSPSGRTCAGDISQTLDRGSRFPVGSCALGQFVPYRRP